jgi:hypothetical protein
MTPSFEDAAPDRFDLLYHFSQITPEQAVELEEKARKFDEAEAAKKVAAEAQKEAATATAES